MAVTVKIKSGDLSKALKDIRKVKNDINKKTGVIIIKGAFDIERKAKRATPVVTGRLRASERILDKRRDNLGAEVGTDVIYAPGVEENTPYLEPAFNSVSPKIIKAITQLLKNA